MRTVVTHRRVDGDQRTTVRFEVGCVAYEFEGPPHGSSEDYEYLNGTQPPERAVERLETFLGEA